MITAFGTNYRRALRQPDDCPGSKSNWNQRSQILLELSNIEHQVWTQKIILVCSNTRQQPTQRRTVMSDNVTLFPHILQPAVALKAYAPMGAKFWEYQATTLDGIKEFSDGWFARRHRGIQAAVEAAKHIGEAATPTDMLHEYQNWLTRATELLAEDAKAYQQHVLKAGSQLSANPETRKTDEHEDKRQTG